jgi:hypothetical protein
MQSFTPAHTRVLPTRVLRASLAAMLIAMAALVSPPRAEAQTAHAATAGQGTTWSQLTPAQRNALEPLKHEWSSIDASRQKKWIRVARRMPAMPPAERERVQARMTAWAHLSPQQRGRARLGFERAKQASPRDRQAKWQAYQALPAEQKQRLQVQARSARPAQGHARPASAPHSGKSHTKSNIVPNPSFAVPPRQISPTAVQAQPGATTTLISKRPAPPAHQQAGLPKIAATPAFVDSETLLPQRGPQAAATRSVASRPAASAAVQRP